MVGLALIIHRRGWEGKKAAAAVAVPEGGMQLQGEMEREAGSEVVMATLLLRSVNK